MISAKKVIRLVRFKEKDNNEIRFSDYDIIQSLNEAIRYCNMRLSMFNSDFLEKAKDYDEDAINEEIAAENAQLTEEEQKEPVKFPVTGVDLPDDFLSLMGVFRMRDDYKLKCAQSGRKIGHDEYYIMGNKLFCHSHRVRMLYRASIEEVENVNSNIDLPANFADGLAKMTSMILNNSAETDVMREALDRVLDSMVPRRRYSNMRIQMPFKIGGY